MFSSLPTHGSWVAEPLAVRDLTVFLFPVEVPGFGFAHVRVVAPAEPGTSPDAVGFRPVRNAPSPVVILANGAGCPPERLHWLAVELAHAGFAAVSYGLLQRIGPNVTWSPGIDIAAAAPDAADDAVTCPVFVPILDALRTEPQLESLETLHPVLFGHSAGGSVALTSAGRRGLEDVAGVVAYGTHLVASSTSGRPAGSVITTLAPAVLIIGGAVDGVVQSAIDAGRYGDGTTPEELLRRSVEEGSPRAGFAAAAQLLHGGHFACTEGYDGLGSSGHLEADPTAVDRRDRELIGALIVSFASAAFDGDFAGVDGQLTSPRSNLVGRKPM